MKFVLVTTCKNESLSFPDWKADILGQTRQPDDIVIVDSRSTDGTTELLKAWAHEDARVKIIVEQCTPARGRNIAIAKATCETIVSADFGVRYDKNWFGELCQPLEDDPRVMAVAGNYATDRQSLADLVGRANYYYSGDCRPKLEKGFLPSSRSVAYRRSLWEKLGGYAEDLTFSADDTVFGLQIVNSGVNVAYAPKAMCYWSGPSSLKEHWKVAFNYARGNGQALIMIPGLLRRNPQGIGRMYREAYACYRAVQGSLSALRRAIVGGDIFVIPVIPILIYGLIKNNLIGFELGMREGAVRCRECRKRLGK